MILFLVECKEGVAYPKWTPMGMYHHHTEGVHLTTDEPYSLFKTENYAMQWLADAAEYHKDTADLYRITQVEI